MSTSVASAHLPLFLAFAKARKELLAALAIPAGQEKKTAIVYDGDALFFQLRTDSVGVSAIGLEPGLVLDAIPSATTAPAADKPKRGRPPADKAADPIPGPGSTPAAETPAQSTAPAATPAAGAMTKDQLRAIARNAAKEFGVGGIEKVRAIIGAQSVDDLKPETYATHKAAIEKALEDAKATSL